MLLVENDYTIVRFDAHKKRLHATAKVITPEVSYNDDVWKQLNIDLLHLIETHKPITMLLDSTEFDYIVSPTLQIWYAQEIAQKIYIAGVERIAVVMSPNFVVNLATEQLVEEIEDRKVITTFFGNIDAAVDWLNS